MARGRPDHAERLLRRAARCSLLVARCCRSSDVLAALATTRPTQARAAAEGDSIPLLLLLLLKQSWQGLAPGERAAVLCWVSELVAAPQLQQEVDEVAAGSTREAGQEEGLAGLDSNPGAQQQHQQQQHQQQQQLGLRQGAWQLWASIVTGMAPPLDQGRADGPLAAAAAAEAVAANGADPVRYREGSGGAALSAAALAQLVRAGHLLAPGPCPADAGGMHGSMQHAVHMRRLAEALEEAMVSELSSGPAKRISREAAASDEDERASADGRDDAFGEATNE